LRWEIFDSVEEKALLQDHRDIPLEAWALREVFVRALQGVFDHRLGSLSLSNPPLERHAMTLEQRPSGGGSGDGEELAQLPQAEAGLLAAQDERYTVDMLLTVTASTVHPRNRGQKPLGFPVPQDVGG
jgi:hypothetical protein